MTLSSKFKVQCQEISARQSRHASVFASLRRDKERGKAFNLINAINAINAFYAISAFYALNAFSAFSAINALQSCEVVVVVGQFFDMGLLGVAAFARFGAPREPGA